MARELSPVSTKVRSRHLQPGRSQNGRHVQTVKSEPAKSAASCARPWTTARVPSEFSDSSKGTELRSNRSWGVTALHERNHGRYISETVRQRRTPLISSSIPPARNWSMKLPTLCPFEAAPQEQRLGTRRHGLNCCRPESGHLGDEPPLCRLQETESETYRFLWRSSFNGAAFVHIACCGSTVELRSRVLGRSRLYQKEPAITATLSSDDWEKLQRALTISNFWSLDATDDERFGLDGAQWLIEGRRGNVYHSMDRWCPRGAIYDLGRLFFALAGPPLADIRLY